MKLLIINGIQIELEKKRIKNMYMRIQPPEGRVRISAPYGMKEENIRSFVLSKLDWIEEQQGKVQQSAIHQELEYVSGEEIYVWGRKLSLQVNEQELYTSMDISQYHIVLYVKSGSTTKQREKVVSTWYKKALQQEIPSLISKWEMIIGVKSSGFCIRDMKTRWGTCNIRTKKICLNLQLAKKPPKCLEYVIVHELVHLLEKSHNHIFKGYMDKYLPQWRAIKKELNGIIS
ncbi:MAG: SprT family zinc-dependent metalloprotease [Herbinix sp.]|nr:SprT family zinc-dependent metalloprotease [Herbinix sp.]